MEGVLADFGNDNQADLQNTYSAADWDEFNRIQDALVANAQLDNTLSGYTETHAAEQRVLNTAHDLARSQVNQYDPPEQNLTDTAFFPDMIDQALWNDPDPTFPSDLIAPAPPMAFDLPQMPQWSLNELPSGDAVDHGPRVTVCTEDTLYWTTELRTSVCRNAIQDSAR
jgi:hypothetical protein